MGFYNYDFKSVIPIFGVAQIQGFAEDTGIEVELDEDLFTDYTGADGDFTRSRRHGMVGKVKFILAQSSPSNDVLAAIMLADLAANAGVLPFLLKDILGTTDVFAAYGYVMKPPPLSFGSKVGTREWNIRLAAVTIKPGGNAAVLA